ncbi:hypothetical protein [Thermogymnomonas acidicola]|uniref:oligopeptide/dipeptide ABC transporter ATP-binding protein n=1 Tax=Thermogymnomonas acidicola TaxID=399579 RepID=UPI00139676C3|nr:oligopeptide/dipeptide ABC transporter ATP-binding protein [Thermogymnomonas acidicola]
MAAQLCDRIYVMYAGRVLESGPAEEIIERPMHPYTKTLMSSIPHGFYDSPDLPVSQGEPPDLRHLPPLAARSSRAARSPSRSASACLQM